MDSGKRLAEKCHLTKRVQIWATARLNQVPTIFTEDFTNGRRVEGVQFLNPLLPAFDLTRWA